MASLPSPTQVSGKHSAIYEAYYKQVDPKCTGTIEAADAAKFLKKSGLSDVVLSRIWDLSDPKGRGCLDKAGFFVALKLVALAQHGRDIHMRNIFMEPPNPPKVGEIPKTIPQGILSVPASNTDWSMKLTDRLKYEQLFDSLQPVNGLIAGNKVKGVLMDSRLPLETLGKIWDLADQDKDGSLDRHEFAVAMHLVYQALDKRAVPTTLPPELQKPPSHSSKRTSLPKAPSEEGREGFNDGDFVANFPKDIAPPPPPPQSKVLPPLVSTVGNPVVQSNVSNITSLLSTISSTPAPNKVTPTINNSATDWVVTPQDVNRFEIIFRECDKDKDGLVCGLEVKDVFLKTGVPQSYLALIWALCDTNQSGKLNLEQFALAMWMVERTMKGIEPPKVLSANMIPPCMRGGGAITGLETSVTKTEPPQPKYSNPELELISNEIGELSKERNTLEADITQKEADIRIKTGEIRSLQSELDTLVATLKQLEHQKREAQKRLDELESQISKIREQCQKQEETINQQEGELNSKKSELQKLKDQESAAEKELELLRAKVDSLSKQLQDRQLEISQVKVMITELLENQRQMNDAILSCKAAIESGDVYLVSDYSLKVEPNLRQAIITLEKVDQPAKQITDDPYEGTTVTNDDDGFGSKDAFASNGFAFGDTKANNKISSGFDDNFMNAPLSGFDDAFGSSFSAPVSNQSKDPFSSSNADPFGDKQVSSSMKESGKDDFGSDPFAILHAPTSGGQILSPNPPSIQKSGPPQRPESPSPALPPKKSKQPPPRPAPPRPLQGPTKPTSSSSVIDSFSSSSSGFADFADFDKKQSTLLSSLSSSSAKSSNTQQQQQVTSSSSSSTTIDANIKCNYDILKEPLKLISIFEKPKKTSTTKTTTLNSSSSSSISTLTENPSSSSISLSTVTSAPTDFVDDPFKDYRYEDPFNIKDPFDNTEDDNAGDGYHGDNELKDNTNSNSNSNFTSSIPQSNKNTKKDFFDTFDDSFKKLGTKTNNNVSLSAFGDAFTDSNKNLKTSSSLPVTNTNTKSTAMFDYNFDDDFGDDFDKFKMVDTNNSNEIMNNKITVVDTLEEGERGTIKQTNTLNLNENFASFDLFDNNTKKIQNYNLTASNDNNTNSMIRNQTLTKKPKKVNNVNNNNSDISGIVGGKNFDDNENDNKIPDKFVSDYSKPDTFDKDLEAVIQRSLIDQ